MLPTPGEGFAGRYRIESVIGRGGFATVFEATDANTDGRIALKVLTPDRDGYDDDTRRRFQREAKIVGSLRNAHTVRLHDSGVSETGLLYLAFELVGGRDLSEVLGEGPIAPQAVERILLQLLSSLEEAHDAGLLHRDLKPENVRVFEQRGETVVKLLDFGIARSTDYGSPSVTKTGELVGTPRYMSPEQLTAEPLTPASDIYSLGMLALELVVGRDALPGWSWGDQIERLRPGHVVGSPAALPPGSEALMGVIRRMTARDPALRISSAAAARAALTKPSEKNPSLPPSKRAAGRAMFVVAAMALVAAAVALIINTRDSPAARPVPSTRNINALVAAADAAEPAPQGADARLDVDEPGDAAPGSGSLGCGFAPPVFRDTRADEVLYIPRDYDRNVAYPMMVLLHDDYQSPKKLFEDGGFRELAEREGVIAYAPSGSKFILFNQSWRRIEESVDAVTAGVTAVLETYCVDPGRVFVISNGDGGHIAERLMCKDWAAAIATNSHITIHPPTWCEPKPYITVFPSRSESHKLEGGPNCSANPKRARAEIDAERRRIHDCGPKAAVEFAVPDSLRCETWSCEVAFVSCASDAGYGWPGVSPGPAASCETVSPGSAPTADMVWDWVTLVSRDAEESSLDVDR